jgi:hypothetical protein
MRPSISSAFSPRPSPKDAVPYSSAAQCQDLERLRGIWEHIQARHDRNAIDAYLSDVYGLVAVWAAEGREVERARRALRLLRFEVSDREGPFAAVIRCTGDPSKADERTRSERHRVQAGFRATGAVHPPQGRHQRLRRSVLSASGARCPTLARQGVRHAQRAPTQYETSD